MAPSEQESAPGGLSLPTSPMAPSGPETAPAVPGSLDLEAGTISVTDAGETVMTALRGAGTSPGEGSGDEDLPGAKGGDGSSLQPMEVEQPVVRAPGWRRVCPAPSLQGVHSSIPVADATSRWFAKLASFAGVGFVVSVGYMDPGNWATDLAGGSQFGYTLLCVVLLSSLMSMFLQHLALKLGAATERDLAQACRDAFPSWLCYVLWIIAEIAIASTDLAEVIGSAIALNLLFGLPLWVGVLITGLDVLLLLLWGNRNFRLLELLVFFLVLTIAICFTYELAAVGADWGKVFLGFIPSTSLFTDPEKLYVAIGIIGATVMPHNLYLHSSLIQTRAYPRTDAGKRMAIHFGSWDSTLSLIAAFFVNSAILIVAAAAFHYGSNPQVVEDISEAYHLMAPVVGSKGAAILFGIGLLASGQNSSITGTLSGQIVMEGFLHIHLPPPVRRLATRLVAIVPACLVAALAGSNGVAKLLVLSQVILSLALPFSVAPLVYFTNSSAYMEKFRNVAVVRVVGIALTLLISGLNIFLVYQAIATNQLVH